MIFTLLAFIGDALKKLEEKGVVIRFVIGRRFSFSLSTLFSYPCSSLPFLLSNDIAFLISLLCIIAILCTLPVMTFIDLALAVQTEVIA